MNKFLEKIKKVSGALNVGAGLSLVFVIFLTLADIILRFFKSPIVGTYELVAYAGAIAIGFSLPFTSWVRGHIYVDFFIGRIPLAPRRLLHTTTRLLGIALFLIIGWNLIKMGKDLQSSGEVSLTLQFPFFYIIYGLGACCLVEILVLFADIIKVFQGTYE